MPQRMMNVSEQDDQRHREVYVIRRCPLCKGQCEGTSWSSHYGNCPNRNKMFVVEELSAITLDDAVRALEAGYAPQNPTTHHPADWIEQWFRNFASTATSEADNG